MKAGCSFYPRGMRLHFLYKSKHLIRPLIRIMFFLIGQSMSRLKILAPKLVDLKTALVDIEMDIALLKIRRTGLLDNRFRVERLHSLPCAISDALAVFFGQSKKNFKFIMMRAFIDFQDHTANIFTIHNDTVGFTLRVIYAALDGITGNDFAIIVNLIIPLTKLNHSAIFERPLIVQNELLSFLRH